MKICTFELNGKPMSNFVLDGVKYPAFSGDGIHVNKKESACMRFEGPIPPGEYFIVDRLSGGFLGGIRDWWSEKDRWFSLYANDGRVDDFVKCEETERGNFRLHPKGSRGLSYGCITIERLIDFQRIDRILRGGQATPISGTRINAYGKVLVK